MTSKFRRRTPGIAPWCPRHIIPQLIFFSSFQNFSNYSFDVSSIRSNYKIFPLEQIPSIKITPWITRPIVSIVSSIEILKNLYIEKQSKIKVKIITFVTNNENTISFFIITILADFSYEFYEDRSFRAQRTKKKKNAWMNWRGWKERRDGKRVAVLPGFLAIYQVNRCPFVASLLYAVRENVSLVNGRSTRHVARAIGSEKHLWKRASPFTSEATDYLIPSGRAQGEKMTVCEWPRSLPPALSLSLSLASENADRWSSRLSSVTTKNLTQNSPS